MIANARNHSCATERSEHHPRFDCAKTAAELNAVIHVVFLGLDRVALQIFGNEREDTAQSLDVADIKHAEIEGNEQHFVRINHDRVRFAPAVRDPFSFRQKREPGAVSAVDVQPDFILTTNIRDLRDRIDARGRGCPHRRDGRERFKLLGKIPLDHRAQRSHIHPKLVVGRNALHIFFAQAESDRRFLNRTVRLV